MVKSDSVKKMGKMAWEGKEGSRRYFNDFGIIFHTPYGDIEANYGDKPMTHDDGFNSTDCYHGSIRNNGDGGITGSYSFWLWWNEDTCEAKFEGAFHSSVPHYFDTSKIENAQKNYSFESIQFSFDRFISDFITEAKEGMASMRGEPLPYGASTKKSIPFSEMVKKQRKKNINKAIDRDWIALRCEGVKEDYEHLKQEILSIFQDFVDEMEIENGESFMNNFQSYEFIDVDEAVDNMVKTVKRQFGIQ